MSLIIPYIFFGHIFFKTFEHKKGEVKEKVFEHTKEKVFLDELLKQQD